MKVELKNYQVDLKETFTWGDKEKLQNVYLKGAKIDQTGMKDFDASVVSEAKYMLLEISILSIRDKEGNNVLFSKEWMNNLEIEDGDLLYSKCDELSNKKKIITS